jgi:glycosyltransferase involved in cell wall biosynthesis
MNKITYLVTVYNEIKTVERAIKDVLNIKYKNKEIIVIDNGSNDGSKKIIQKFSKIKSILRKKNFHFYSHTGLKTFI